MSAPGRLGQEGPGQRLPGQHPERGRDWEVKKRDPAPGFSHGAGETGRACVLPGSLWLAGTGGQGLRLPSGLGGRRPGGRAPGLVGKARLPVGAGMGSPPWGASPPFSAPVSRE